LDGELEDAVNDDKVEYTVIVSSIQVLTTNPMVESWGHFPVEKRRLMSLLKRHRPRGAVILSGDVHHGEIASVQGITEVTSSGLTHSCSGPWYGFVCDYMLRWGQARSEATKTTHTPTSVQPPPLRNCRIYSHPLLRFV